MAEYIKVRSACYEVDGETIHIPHACLECHKRGLLLAYNHEKHWMEAICGAREDAKGTFIPGCDTVSFVIKMTKAQFHAIVHDPRTSDIFFCLEVL